jgi:hypothetical protein
MEYYKSKNGYYYKKIHNIVKRIPKHEFIANKKGGSPYDEDPNSYSSKIKYIAQLLDSRVLWDEFKQYFNNNNVKLLVLSHGRLLENKIDIRTLTPNTSDELTITTLSSYGRGFIKSWFYDYQDILPILFDNSTNKLKTDLFKKYIREKFSKINDISSTRQICKELKYKQRTVFMLDMFLEFTSDEYMYPGIIFFDPISQNNRFIHFNEIRNGLSCPDNIELSRFVTLLLKHLRQEPNNSVGKEIEIIFDSCRYLELNESGYNKNGYNQAGYNQNGYNQNGYNNNDYNKNGYKKNGYNKNGYNKNGYNKNGYNHSHYDGNGNNGNGNNGNGNNGNGNGLPNNNVNRKSFNSKLQRTVSHITNNVDINYNNNMVSIIDELKTREFEFTFMFDNQQNTIYSTIHSMTIGELKLKHDISCKPLYYNNKKINDNQTLYTIFLEDIYKHYKAYRNLDISFNIACDPALN